MRFKAIHEILTREAVTGNYSEKLSEIYGRNVFGMEKMRNYLPKEAFSAIERAVTRGLHLDRSYAEQIAAGMKQWALENNCTHYTHWFQPLTGSTAEKHDSFFEPIDQDRAVEKFSGNALVQQEPDASSFPNGGLRNTFEARGYTAWDPSSPAFIMEYPSGKTLCIPTVFVSYTGEALDFKAPLLKALHSLEEATVAVCQSYFDRNVKKAHASLGIEQEYFLVDEALYFSRQDLMLTGRTLVGLSPAKGQQLEDHYFGSIPDRVHSFMAEMEYEAVKLGIPLKTRHNEVAPAQFECAPMFEEANLAIDHNQLLMDLMDKIARKHKLRVLLHEKPYAGVNGSGKHNNWSIITDTGVNLLSPGTTPKNNLQFLTFFVNVIKAVHDYDELLRASIASASNDHRLGANEAPPAIMSVFIGTQLTKVLNEFKKEVAASLGKPRIEGDNKIKVKKIPEILVDNTDRNRTSPFAFTGNKFEFRAVGSSANCANAMIVLNTIVAEQLRIFKSEVDQLIHQGDSDKVAIATILRKYVKNSKKILFEGNGYSEEWLNEALQRGLKNVTSTPAALNAYQTKSTRKLFASHGIFNERELEARHDIMLEIYVKKIQIESRVLGEMVSTQIIPAAIQYQTALGQNIQTFIAAGIPNEKYLIQQNLMLEISDRISILKNAVEKMTEARKKANNMESMHERALSYCNDVIPFFNTIRYESDKLELIVDDSVWPLPKYRELLFLR